MRGTLPWFAQHADSRRIIPAHAGNSALLMARAICHPDHPRACGELEADILKVEQTGGSSPRMRGTLESPPVSSMRLSGSSPRMRGTPKQLSQKIAGLRIIPAHAGNSAQIELESRDIPDHPRACGELVYFPPVRNVTIGSSPRMRGTLERTENSHPIIRIIPAHAGNSGTYREQPSYHPDHPRACGELLNRVISQHDKFGSSPRMRGTLLLTLQHDSVARIIPAHAGNS